MDLNGLLNEFIAELGPSAIDIYNEPGLQHELALFLRPRVVPEGYRFELERNSSHFQVQGLPKSEMDIVIYRPDRSEMHCIELKVPLQVAVPERMFQFCIDLAFLEGLRRKGFASGMAPMITNDSNFWQGTRTEALYGAFRCAEPCTGRVPALVRRKGLQEVELASRYRFTWNPLRDGWRYLLATV